MLMLESLSKDDGNGNGNGNGNGKAFCRTTPENNDLIGCIHFNGAYGSPSEAQCIIWTG